MKVVMIGAYPLQPGEIKGGIESVTSTLVPSLAECDDIEGITVIRFHRGDAVTSYRREGPKVEVHYLRGQDRLRTITGSFLDVRKARKLIAQIQPDVVHGQEIGWFGDIATRCGAHSVVTVHGLPHVEIRLQARDGFRHKLRIMPVENMVRRVLRRARVVISISRYDAERLDGMISGSRVSIANPTDASFFELAPSGSTAPRLLFAGVLTPRKNVLGLLNAFALVRNSMPQARLAMVGPAPDAEYAAVVEERISELGLDGAVDRVGFVDNDRLRDEISAARAVVLFSREETAPTIIAQAMAAGKPVVSSRVGGVSEMVVDGETGFLMGSEDETTLADRLLTVLRDQDLCLDMGRRAHDVARQRFSPDAVAARTVEAYRAALGRPARTHTDVLEEMK